MLAGAIGTLCAEDIGIESSGPERDTMFPQRTQEPRRELATLLGTLDSISKEH